jgi:two-component system, LytTR family, sensor histidine kinase AlgZ
MQPYFQRHRIFFMHLLFWCMYYSFFFYQISSSPKGAERELSELLMDASFHVFSMIFISYLNYFYFFPRFLVRQNLGRYLLEFTIPFGLFLTAFIHIKRFIADGYTYKFEFMYSQRFTIYMAWSTFFMVMFVAMLKFVEDWFELEAKKKEIENEKLIAELRFLKAQINPHFLFNTLNNLYSLAFMNSPNTTVVIDKLSQMMRYMIYDSNHPKVSLNKEIDYMHNYISLEQLRLNNEVPISVKIRGNTEGVYIVPLINITLEVSGTACIYTVENSRLSQKDEKTKEKSGIGLQNVQRRLDLSYPNRYDLTVEDNAQHYLVHLSLDLTN